MKERYILRPSNVDFVIAERFPKLDPGKKAAVMLSGGMESSLITLMCKEIYGEDNVLIFYTEKIFTGGYGLSKSIQANIKNAAVNLDVDPKLWDVEYYLHKTNQRESIKLNLEMAAHLVNAQYVFFGFTKLFFDVEPFRQPGVTPLDYNTIAYSDPEKHKSVIEEFYLPLGYYHHTLETMSIPPGLYPILRDNRSVIQTPFEVLNKAEVVDLYYQQGLMDKLFKTRSCQKESIAESGMHCGECFSCQQRYDSFDILNDPNVVDKTNYISTDVISRKREELKKIMKNE